MFRQISTAAVEKALSCLSLRQEAIAGNLANAETPGYRSRRVDFEQALEAAIERGNDNPAQPPEETIARVRPHVRYQGFPDGTPEAGGLERELTDLAETSLHYETLTQVYARQMRMLRKSITGGGG